jgi:hypothetical protein
MRFKSLKTGDKLTFERVLMKGPDGSTRFLGHPVYVEIK